MSYLSYVNVLQGTNSTPEFSHGNILPVCAVPFGMNNFVIETRGSTASLFYNPNDTRTTGIRLTHTPSPWISDYATFTLSAGAGNEGPHPYAYTPSRTVYTPAQINLTLMQHEVGIHLVPTVRGAIINLTYPKALTRRFYLTMPDAPSKIEIIPEKHRIIGYTAQHTWTVPDNFKMYFVIEFDCDFDLNNTVLSHHGENFKGISLEANNATLNLAFADKCANVTARLATSFISEKQAEINLSREVSGKDLPTLLKDAESEWEDKLSQIEIEADEKTMRTFYSCLYRMTLFPRIFYEFDEQGITKHYSPDTGKICDGVMFTDNGFWDTYKTVYPLFSLIRSDLYLDMCRGFCNFANEAGWLPRWMSPGSVNCMPGTAIDAVFGDAAAKNVVTDKNLLREMLTSTMVHVNNVAPRDEYGRDGVENFNRLGYVTSDRKESVNKTQDYAYGNYCIAQIANKLGETELAQKLLKSSLNYRNLWDNSVGFMRARDENGNMRDNWNCFQWGGDYTEGSSWQNSFAMFHDFRGLAKIMGGKDRLEAKLDELFATEPKYDVYGYGFEIHEMIEMAAVDFGQFAISNQPSFHLPYIYSIIGKPEKAAYWIRRAIKELFDDTPNGYPGDEDNGSMAGWYVFSALGFYPVCPGAPEYVLGSPAIKRAVIHADSGKDITIECKGQSEKAIYVDNIEINGKNIHRTFFTQDELKDGANIVFNMSEEAKGGNYGENELPFSLEH